MTRIQCNYMLAKLPDALYEAKNLVARKPDFYPGPGLAAALAVEVERADLAAEMGRQALRLDPQFSAKLFVRWQGLKDAAHRERLFRALKTAGLPD